MFAGIRSGTVHLFQTTGCQGNVVWPQTITTTEEERRKSIEQHFLMGMDQRTASIFVCLYMGYMVITYIRKAVSFAAPAVIETEDISKSQFVIQFAFSLWGGITPLLAVLMSFHLFFGKRAVLAGAILVSDFCPGPLFAHHKIFQQKMLEGLDAFAGLILSSQMVGYSVGKLLGGLLVDLFSPSHIFIITLVLSAFSVVAFTAFDTVAMFAFCWFINGLSQGPSWPACGLLIKRWCLPERFGTWWSVLSTSANVSGTAGPILSAFLMTFFGWRFALNIASTCALAVAGMAFLLLADGPEKPPLSSEGSKTEKTKPGWKSDVLDLVKRPVFVATCISFLLVSLVRGACTDWGQLYLIQDHHHSHLTGSSFTSCQELGGIVGSLAAGYASDFLMAKKFVRYNPRMLVVFICTLVLSASIFFFMSAVSSTSSGLLISVTGLCIGFGVYGCTALLGIVAMESTVDRLAGTAHAFASLAANVGLVLSGFPLSVVARQHGWHAAFMLVQIFTAITTAVALFSVHCSAGSSTLLKEHRR